MLTKTTLTAVRTLMHAGLSPSADPLSIRRIAEHLGESPTYMAKVAGLLVKAGILRAQRGVLGGIALNRPPAEITLLEVVEASQGAILPDFCRETKTLTGTCAFHVAAAELHQAMVGVLARWTLAHLLRRPAPTGHAAGQLPCMLLPCASHSLIAPGRRERENRSGRVNSGRNRGR